MGEGGKRWQSVHTNCLLMKFPGSCNVLLIPRWPEVSHMTITKLQGRLGNVPFIPECYVLCQKVYSYGKTGEWVFEEN